MGTRVVLVDWWSRRALIEGAFFLAFFLLAMAALTAGLGVFTAIHHPGMSHKFNMVASFWSVMGWPFIKIWHLLVAVVPVLGDLAAKALSLVDTKDAVSNAVGGLLSTTLAALLFRGRLAAVRTG